MIGKINKIIFVLYFILFTKIRFMVLLIDYSYFIYNILPYSFNINTIKLIILIYACFS